MARADESAKENCTLQQNASAEPVPVPSGDESAAYVAVAQKKNSYEDLSPQQRMQTIELLDNATVENQDENADYGNTMKTAVTDGGGMSITAAAAAGKEEQQDVETLVEKRKEPQQPEEDAGDVTMRDEPAKEEEQRAEEVAVAASVLMEGNATAAEEEVVVEVEQEKQIELIEEQTKQLDEQAPVPKDANVALEAADMLQQIVPILELETRSEPDALAAGDASTPPTVALNTEKDVQSTPDAEMEIPEVADKSSATTVVKTITTVGPAETHGLDDVAVADPTGIHVTEEEEAQPTLDAEMETTTVPVELIETTADPTEVLVLADDATTQPAVVLAPEEEARQTRNAEMETSEIRDEVSATTVVGTTAVADLSTVALDLEKEAQITLDTETEASMISLNLTRATVSETPSAIADSTETQPVETVLYEDTTSEQWFVDDDGNADDDDELIPIITEGLSDDDDDDPVFVGTTSTMDTFKLDPNASSNESAKRKRASDGGESDSTLVLDSGSEHEKSNLSSSSSNSSSSSDSSSDSNSSGSENDSDSDDRKRKRTPTKKARRDPPSSRAEAKPKNPKAARVRRVIPPEYLAFGSVDRDGREFPILRGTYKIKNNRRAVFSGHWGFSEADFAAGGDRVSKFEYTSVPLHGRRNSDRRPFSGKYSGYFNFRQFSGKIIRIKEGQVELNFLKMPREDRLSDEEDDDDSDDYYEENEAAHSYAKYEVYGKGKNQFGRFLIRGYLNPAAGTIGVRRKYLD